LGQESDEKKTENEKFAKRTGRGKGSFYLFRRGIGGNRTKGGGEQENGAKTLTRRGLEGTFSLSWGQGNTKTRG